MMKPNQDIRDYMADHCVSQKALAAEVGVSQMTISRELSTELSQQRKEVYLNLIDAIFQRAVCDQHMAEDTQDEDEVAPIEYEANSIEEDETEIEEEECEDESGTTKFQIGDRVIIPSKANKVGIVADIWSSQAKNIVMYSVENQDDGYCGMYSEHQLELEPLPIEYTFESIIDGNVAVVAMNATQGDKTWVYARGHAHILHDGPVGMRRLSATHPSGCLNLWTRSNPIKSISNKEEARDDYQD